MSLVSGFALETGLIPFLALVLIARPADRKCAYIASNKNFTIHSHTNVITADLAGLSIKALQGLALTIKTEKKSQS